MKDEANLGTLIASRICHDLVSPLSAIGNGVELLAMTLPPGPELSLISESVEAALARVRFFRLAFGHAGSGHLVGRGELVSLFDSLSRAGRLRFDWQVEGDLPRDRARLALLLAACAEAALPQGGRIALSGRAARLRLEGHGPRVRIDAGMWDRLARREIAPDARPGEAQFAAAAALMPAGDRLSVETGEHGISIAF